MIPRYSRTVTRTFRDEITALYPGAFKDATLTRAYLLQWLLLSHEVERPLTRALIGTLADQEAQARAGNLNTGDILKDFEDATGIKLNVTEARHWEHKARTVRPELSGEVRTAVLNELKRTTADRTDLVDFVHGRSRAGRAGARAFAIREDEAYADVDETRPGGEVAAYFRDLPTNAFTKYSGNLDALIHAAVSANLSDGKMLPILASVHELRDGLKPLLYQYERTERLFSAGYSLQTLPRTYRRMLLRGTIEADLQAAHLRIAAYSWPIPELMALFGSETPVWQSLAKEAGVPLTAEHKAILKTAVYAALYGASRKTLNVELSALGREAGNRFLASPLVRALLTARDERINEIERRGGIETVRGWIPRDGERPYRLLVRHAMDAESHLIGGVYEVATAYPNLVRVLSHEHDGVTFEVLDRRRSERVLIMLQEAVGARGKAIGVPSCLEFADHTV